MQAGRYQDMEMRVTPGPGNMEVIGNLFNSSGMVGGRSTGRVGQAQPTC